MTPEPAASATTAPRSRWRRWRITGWLVLVLLAFFAYGMWRVYDFRAAITEAKALGWRWEFADPFDAIQKDWKAVLQKETWFGGERDLVVGMSGKYQSRGDVVNLDKYGRLLRRLNPRTLHIQHARELKDLSALTGLTNLRELQIVDLPKLTNVDALEGLPGLREIVFTRCADLTNVDALKKLKRLQKLRVNDCKKLPQEAIDALKATVPDIKITRRTLTMRRNNSP